MLPSATTSSWHSCTPPHDIGTHGQARTRRQPAASLADPTKVAVEWADDKPQCEFPEGTTAFRSRPRYLPGATNAWAPTWLGRGERVLKTTTFGVCYASPDTTTAFRIQPVLHRTLSSIQHSAQPTPPPHTTKPHHHQPQPPPNHTLQWQHKPAIPPPRRSASPSTHRSARRFSYRGLLTSESNPSELTCALAARGPADPTQVLVGPHCTTTRVRRAGRSVTRCPISGLGSIASRRCRRIVGLGGALRA